MTAAKVIAFPAPADAQQPAKGNWTKLDNATDMAALYALPNALLKPALCLLEHRHMRPLHWGEIASTIGRGATQTREALSRLAELGYDVSDGDTWAWAKSAASRKSVRKVARKPVRKSERKSDFLPTKKTVWGGISLVPKEVKERSKEINNTYVLRTFAPAQSLAVAGGTALENQNPQPTPSQEKTMTDKPAHESDTDSEKVPPAAPAEADPVSAAYAALEAAGLLPVWEKWFEANPALRRNRVALEAQICQFAEWAATGLGDKLRENALDIVSAGTFAHPFNTIKSRFEKVKAVQHAEKQTVAELTRAYGEPECEAGQRRRAPDGKVWTVAYIEYGMVFFEELDAPLDVPDRVAAGWEVVA